MFKVSCSCSCSVFRFCFYMHRLYTKKNYLNKLIKCLISSQILLFQTYTICLKISFVQKPVAGTCTVRNTINHSNKRSCSETAEGNDPINTCTAVHPACQPGQLQRLRGSGNDPHISVIRRSAENRSTALGSGGFRQLHFVSSHTFCLPNSLMDSDKIWHG